MDDPKVLVACPVSDHKDYVLLDWLVYTNNLTYSNYELLIVDNSQDPEYHKKFVDYGFNVIRVDPNGRINREYIAECLETIREFALKGGFDYFFSLECDIFPPRNIIEWLLTHHLPVVSCAYYTGIGEDSAILLQDIDNIGDWHKVHDMTTVHAFRQMDGKVKPIYANGIGCCLIRRDVLELIPFRISSDDEGYPDSFFHQDLFINGIINYVDTSVVVRHYNHDWSDVEDYYEPATSEK